MLIANLDVVGFKAFIREIGFLPFIKPAIHVIPVNASRPEAWNKLERKFNDAEGFEVLKHNKDKYTVTIKCQASSKSSSLSKASDLAVIDPHTEIEALLRDITFDVEIFAVSQRGQAVRLSVIRLVQRAGPASSLRRILHEVLVTINSQGLAVTDTDKANDIINALWAGLQPRIAQTEVNSDGSFTDI
jgi:hypothetical protein